MPSLTSLHISMSGQRRFIPYGGLQHLLTQIDVSRLRKLSILGIVIGTPTLSTILTCATRLQELYLSVNTSATVLECPELASERTRATRACACLRVLHVNAPERWAPGIRDLESLAKSVPTLEQLGSGNRVYEVVRRYGTNGEREVRLRRWARTGVPGYFQIWRG